MGHTPGWERSDGALIVQRAVEAHGGLERWQAFEKVTFRYRERWSFPFQLSNPWPTNPVSGILTLWLHTDRVEAQLDGLEQWDLSYENGRLLAIPPDPGGPGELDWNGAFVLPRTHYLTLLPFKFLDGGARIEYLGCEHGFDEVLVSFRSGAGATSKDRYWAYFDHATGRLERIVLTVTACGPLAVGDLRYEDYHDIQGLLMPSRIRAYLNGPGLPLHLGEYSDMRFE